MTTPTPPTNGTPSQVAAHVVKALGQNPSLLAMVVLVGLMLYVFGERLAARIDYLASRIDCVAPQP